MLMGSGKKIGAGAGVAIGVLVVIFLIIVVFYATEYDDARLASIIASYDDDIDRLRVVIYLTDSNGDYTKASGDADVTILQEGGHMVYSHKYYFVKDNFVTWKSVLGGDRITAYIIDIKQFFPSSGGEVSGMMGYEVYVDLNTKTKHWEDIRDEFWSFE